MFVGLLSPRMRFVCKKNKICVEKTMKGQLSTCVFSGHVNYSVYEVPFIKNIFLLI
jgi:hypothetical protein